MSKIDFDAINARAVASLESLVRQWLPQGHKEGGEFKIGSLSGEPGRSLSINLRTGEWKDFASGDGGSDPISLLAAIRGCSMADAAREIDGGVSTTQAVAPVKPKNDPADWKAQPHAPENTPAPTFKHHRFGTPSKTWEYRDAEGRTVGFICRFELADGGKDVVPRSWCKHPDGRAEWRWKAFAELRPLYGLDLIAKSKPDAGVLIVEGEKAADAARRLLPGVVVATWPGGSKAVKKTDWSPLNGRPVIIWPDNDEPGFKAALAIAGLVSGAKSIRVVTPPTDAADGWDAADAESEGFDVARARAMVKSAVTVEEFAARAKRPTPPAVNHDAQAPWDGEEPPPTWQEPSAHPDPDDGDNRVQGMPFQLLGMDGDKFHYLPDNGQHLVSLTASAHTKNNLFQLAPLQRWENEFPGKDGGASWDTAVNALISRTLRLPKFDPRRVRGRGCWIDGEDIVFHAGDQLYIGGKAKPIPYYRSHVRAVYEGGLEIEVDANSSSKSSDAGRLIELCEMLSWERPLYGKLLAGWLALAPICGAMQWRPHVWITGPSGSGKSWTVANIVSQMVGSSAVHVQGNTTEAGLRQQIGCDALPIVFDEAESEDKRGQQRLDGVLELARQASSESGAGIVKGGANGASITYLVRSCFLFASIGVAAVKKADVSRVSVLTLKKNLGDDAQTHFESIKAFARETTQDASFCSRIRARSLRLAKVIRSNALTFSDAAVAFTGDKRSADQVGALLAGAFSLTSSREVTREFASEWMAKQDWSGFQSEEVDNDENQCVSHLFAAQIRVERRDAMATTITVDEAIEAANKTFSRQDLQSEDCAAALNRVGIKVRPGDGRVFVANSHPGLEKIFSDTPWSRGKWKQQLERVPGAKKEPVINFGHAVRQRAVSLPL